MRNQLLVFMLSAAGFLPVWGQAPLPPLPKLELLFPHAHQSPRLATGAIPPPAAFDSHKIYTCVELMPRLRTAAGYQNISEAIQQRVVLPKGSVTCVGRVMANFVMEASGAVAKPRIVRGVSPACDAAVLQAIWQLPRFEPGMQNGLKVVVDYTVPVLLPEKTIP